MTENIMFIACGSFNPPTPMHCRMFEIARDYFRDAKLGNVIGGIISPVHDSYRKPNVQLVSAEHRCQMIKLTYLPSEWIRLSDWETKQPNWTKTNEVLHYHQNFINSILNDSNQNRPNERASWIPDNLTKWKGQRVRICLLCGADFLETFANKSLWSDAELTQILEYHGIVVMTRHGCDPEKSIFASDLLYKYRTNITIIKNWVPNEISSTSIRLHLRRGLSVKYLLKDEVILYISKNNLYGSKETQKAVSKAYQLDQIKDASSDIIIDAKYVIEQEMDETDCAPNRKKQSHQNNNRPSHSRKRKKLPRKQANNIKHGIPPNQTKESSADESD